MADAKQDYIKVAKEVDDVIRRVIMPIHKDALDKMRGIHNKYGRADAKVYVLEKIKEAIPAFNPLKTAIEPVSLIFIFSRDFGRYKYENHATLGIKKTIRFGVFI
jgi:hypothetical protein